MAALSRALGALLLGTSAPAAALLITYVESDHGCEDCVALGYPVPMPVESLTPVDGFRSYASLQARLQALAALSDDLRSEVIGTTHQGRDIVAWLVGDPDTVRADGVTPEPAMLQNGGIHAREWQSPEVVTGIIERLMDNADDAGLHRWLLDHVNMIVIPVLNVDGFLQTQRDPDAVLGSTFTDGDYTVAEAQADGFPGAFATPRDGRMRRKNLLDTDEDLSTEHDFLFGVDLNRNGPSQFWGNNQGNSSDARSLIYRGPARGSEPEIQALEVAASLGPEDRLRFYTDTHSFSRLFYASYTINARRNAVQDALATAMTAVSNERYCYFEGPGTARGCRGNPTPNGLGIGTTEEWFAHAYQIPSFTLEIEPTFDGAATDYGGTNYGHAGFILPDAEIARVRDEMADTFLLAYYRMGGPPVLSETEILDGDGERVFRSSRPAVSPTSRAVTVDTGPSSLQAGGTYTLWLAFDKPMRVRDAGGNVANYAGQAVALAPRIALEGISAAGGAFRHALTATAAGWLDAPGGAPDGYLAYADDAYRLEFTVPSGLPVDNAQRLNLRVEIEDLSGQSLDAEPATVLDWDGGWAGYENARGELDDAGGADCTMRIVDDGSPALPCPSAPARRGGGGGAPSAWLLGGLLLLRGLRRR